MLSDEDRALLADHNDRLLFGADGLDIDVEDEALFAAVEAIASAAARAAEHALVDRIEAAAESDHRFTGMNCACGHELNSPRGWLTHVLRTAVRPETATCTCPDDEFLTPSDCVQHNKPHAWQQDWGIEPNAEADAQFKADNTAIRNAEAATTPPCGDSCPGECGWNRSDPNDPCGEAATMEGAS